MDPFHLHILKIKSSAGVLSELLKFVIVITLVSITSIVSSISTVPITITINGSSGYILACTQMLPSPHTEARPTHG